MEEDQTNAEEEDEKKEIGSEKEAQDGREGKTDGSFELMCAPGELL